jgi:hypothetical protein
MSKTIYTVGFSLERISIDYGIECILQSADRWINLRFTSARLSEVKLIEVDDRDSIPHLLRLLHFDVTELQVDDDSVLIVIFQNGAELRVYPNDEFESWELVTSDSMRMVCMPGGQIAEWN